VDPIVERCTPDAVEARWLTAELQDWRKKGARKLGLALASMEPHTTLLKELVSGPLAGDLPALLVAIAQKLDGMEGAIKKPIEDLSEFMIELFTKFKRGADGISSSSDDGTFSQQINALSMLMKREFNVAKGAMLENFRQDFARHKSELRYKFGVILQNEMVHAPGRSQLERFSRISSHKGTNVKRKDFLKEISHKLNMNLATSLEMLIVDIFNSVLRSFETHFSHLVTVVHRLLSGTSTLKCMEADDALGTTASQQYSRFCAVLIAALRDAAKREADQNLDLEFIKCILEDKDLMDGVDQRIAASPHSFQPSTSRHATIVELMMQVEQEGAAEQEEAEQEAASAPRKKQRVDTKEITWKQLTANKDFCAKLSRIRKDAGARPTSQTSEEPKTMLAHMVQAAQEIHLEFMANGRWDDLYLDNKRILEALKAEFPAVTPSVRALLDFIDSMLSDASGSSMVEELE